MSDGREGFEQARRNEASLNPRQRDVLGLLGTMTVEALVALAEELEK